MWIGFPRSANALHDATENMEGIRVLMAPGLKDSLRALQNRFRLWRWRRRVIDSLALHRRGEARRDGLALVNIQEMLVISWRARPAHPWDWDLSEANREVAFIEQSLADTEAAIQRLFRAFPGAEVLDFKVLDVASDSVIIEGVVSRRDLIETEAVAHSSVRMRLRQLGIIERLTDLYMWHQREYPAGTDQAQSSSNILQGRPAAVVEPKETKVYI